MRARMTSATTRRCRTEMSDFENRRIYLRIACDQMAGSVRDRDQDCRFGRERCTTRRRQGMQESDCSTMNRGRTPLAKQTTMMPGQLFLVAGFPGSGKTHWIRATFDGLPVLVLDDFFADAPGWDERGSRSARFYALLVETLRSGCGAVVSDVQFCLPDRREDIVACVNADVHDLPEPLWFFFQADREQCIRNIRLRARLKPHRDWKTEIAHINDRYSAYTPERNGFVLAVHRNALRVPADES